MLKLSVAEEILSKVIKGAETPASRPLTVVVTDIGGAPIALKRQDGSASGRVKIAIDKAKSALALNIPTSQLAKFHSRKPDIFRQLGESFDFSFLAIPGGVLIKNSDDEVIGAVGVAGGDLIEEEALVVAAISEVGLKPHPDLKA